PSLVLVIHNMPESTASNDTKPTNGSFASLFEGVGEETSTTDASTGGEGQIVSGLVIQITRDAVVVDIGGKSEGVISKSEFTESEGKFAVNVGDRVDVFIESRENDDGLITLSKEK